MTAPSGVSTFGEDVAGEIYVAGYFDGRLYRIDPADADADLLPDWWELAFFGSATAAAANADPDVDGATNLAEYLASTHPVDGQSVPSASPYVPPKITNVNAHVCVIGTACFVDLVATGTPRPQLSRTGMLPSGIGYDAATRRLSGTAAAGTVGTYPQSLAADNGVAPAATQTFTLVVVAACGGFVDVSPGTSHCNSVEWLRNRAIALGCTASQYCPGDAVARGAMALFQHRVGLVITPQLGFTQAGTGPIALAPQAIVCASDELSSAAYPRSVQATYAVSLQTSGALAAAVTLVASRNGGASWDVVTGTRMRIETNGAAWRSANGQAAALVHAGETLRLALAIEREIGSANVDATRCQIASMLVNRDPSSSPHDR
jgi:hypothetical protein